MAAARRPAPVVSAGLCCLNRVGGLNMLMKLAVLDVRGSCLRRAGGSVGSWPMGQMVGQVDWCGETALDIHQEESRLFHDAFERPPPTSELRVLHNE